MKNDIVVINAFPNNEEKLMLLVEQLSYLTKLGKPILLISGCVVPEFIESKVNYLFINTENEVIGKDFSYFLSKNGIHDFAFDFFENDNIRVDFYWSNVNSTIVKNIRLGFELAKSLGYKNVFYTEDDNIWKDGSFWYIEHNLNRLKSGEFKVAGVLGKQHESEDLMIFTTFFFANVEYFLNKFTIPVNSSEWYDIENVKKYYLHKTFEDCFYELLKSNLHLFYNTEQQFLEMLEHDSNNRKNFAWGIYNRRNSEKNLINTFFTVLPTNNGEKHLILNNQSYYLKSGGKTYTINVSLDGIFDSTLEVESGTYYVVKLPNTVNTVTLDIHGYGIVNLDAKQESINNNGYITYKTQNEVIQRPIETNNTIDFVVGGRMGDFFQVLYVVQQYYEQTGKKGNVYITNDLSYGGDAFTKPVEHLYPELLPIMNEQDYINKFEILNGQTTNFINLNDWRLPENLRPENFPWIDLFTKVYLKQFSNLTHKAWIKFSRIALGFKDTVVIHRAHYRITEDEVNWEQLIRDNKCVFVGFDNIQYENFPYKDMLPFHKMSDLSEFCAILNGCKFYVGNQTGPLSIAHAMDVPRLAELCNVDSIHYVGEERYFKELNWISNVMPIPILRTVNNHIKYEPLYTHRT
jgi:hypothetical protein